MGYMRNIWNVCWKGLEVARETKLLIMESFQLKLKIRFMQGLLATNIALRNVCTWDDAIIAILISKYIIDNF